MAFKIRCIIIILLLGSYSYAQKSDSASSQKSSIRVNESLAQEKSQMEDGDKEIIFKPTIGLGTGMLSFYGDIYEKHFQPPGISRIGYELNVAQPLTDYLQFDFYVLHGKLGADERFVAGSRNLNFQSTITAGGINLLYNFDNLLKKDRAASPYITLGIESFEFLSKTDLYDKYGNKYYYWPDGSIRNMSSSDPNSANAIVIQRDYTYETDIRTLNADGFGKYPERSWAVPVGAGFMFKISDHINFKMGATMHFTFTDYIDGITKDSKGIRAGNSQNDKFMMTSVSLHYDFYMKKKAAENKFDEPLNADDLLTMDYSDSDSDGVVDTKDNCPGTPHGVAVDVNGCPLDDDMDGVPNYLDKEPNTPIGAMVDENGVQLTDSMLAYRYDVYMDSTGAFAKVVLHEHNGATFKNDFYKKDYMISIGTFQKAIPGGVMTKILSINDVSSNVIDDSTTMYTVGKYENALDAEKRKQQLVDQGFADAKVIYKQKGSFHDAPVFVSNVTNGTKENTIENKTKENKTSDKTVVKTDNKDKTETVKEVKKTKKKSKKENNKTETTAVKEVKKEAVKESIYAPHEDENSSGVVFRVQLGAFHKRLPKSAFWAIGDLIEIKTEEGLYKYTTGSFKKFGDAVYHKEEMMKKGYKDAFITAYKDGKRISLAEAGASSLKSDEVKDKPANSVDLSKVDKKNITFKIQVGKFKTQVPNDKLEQLTKIKDIKGETAEDGSIRYVVGSFTDYKQAQEFKNEVIKKYGLTDAFIIAFNNSDIIPVKDALEILSK